MAKTVFDVLDTKYADAQLSQQEFILSGAAKDYVAYKEACGVIRGLAIARREVEDLARHYRDTDDD